MSKSRYVLGFLFDPKFENVVLISKNKPEWQRGMLNGIGGKIEASLNENPTDAMVREFSEETGVNVEHDRWHGFAVLSNPNFEMHIFYAIGDDIWQAKTMESERVSVEYTDYIISGRVNNRTIGNLPWLLAMAKAIGKGAEGCAYFEIKEMV